MRSIWIVACMSIVVGALVAAGCGGGGEALGPVPSGTTLEGLVSTSGLSPAANVDVAQVPAADCQVTVERARDGWQIADGRTDDQGRYRFTGLPAGEEALVRARLRSGERLRTRLTLRDGTCRADVNEETTLADECRQLSAGGGPPVDANERQVAEVASGECLRYHEQHRYQYGELGGSPPDFSDDQAIGAAALALLDAATGDALTRARQTQRLQECQGAVTMVAASLRAHQEAQFTWSEQVRQQTALALQQGQSFTPQQVAQAAGSALGEPVDGAAVERMRQRIRATLRRAGAAELDPVEALVGLCMGDGSGDRLRLRTNEQARQCLQLLLGEAA